MQVGETFIPAMKQETVVNQAASYASDSAQKYAIKGRANNNYQLSGSMDTSTSQKSCGADHTYDSLSLKGNLSKKYNQCGNKDLENGCGGCGLKDELLDQSVTDVCSDPAERVNQEVEGVVRRAISKTISQCVQYAMDEALKDMIEI